MTPLRIILADDHPAFRNTVRAWLDEVPGAQVVAEAEDGAAAVQAARELAPDIVLMDVVMPRLNGIEATRRIVASCPATRVIALSLYADRRFVEAMLGAGARGYLMKECEADEIVRALRTVAAGATYLSPALSGVLTPQDLDERTSPDATAP